MDYIYKCFSKHQSRRDFYWLLTYVQFKKKKDFKVLNHRKCRVTSKIPHKQPLPKIMSKIQLGSYYPKSDCTTANTGEKTVAFSVLRENQFFPVKFILPRIYWKRFDFCVRNKRAAPLVCAMSKYTKPLYNSVEITMVETLLLVIQNIPPEVEN